MCYVQKSTNANTNEVCPSSITEPLKSLAKWNQWMLALSRQMQWRMQGSEHCKCSQQLNCLTNTLRDQDKTSKDFTPCFAQHLQWRQNSLSPKISPKPYTVRSPSTAPISMTGEITKQPLQYTRNLEKWTVLITSKVWPLVHKPQVRHLCNRRLWYHIPHEPTYQQPSRARNVSQEKIIRSQTKFPDRTASQP